MTNLTPAQQKAADGLRQGILSGGVCVLSGGPGTGKTLILSKLAAELDGWMLGARQFLQALYVHTPLALEEAFLKMLDEALVAHGLVIVDDLHLLTDVMRGFQYPRRELLEAALTATLPDAVGRGRRVVFSTECAPPVAIGKRAYRWQIGDFGPSDYQAICAAYLIAEQAAQLDFGHIHRFAPRLNGYQLRNASVWLGDVPELSTDRFVEYLHSQHLISNVAIEEVQQVELKDLKGVDEVIQALEAKIALPFENQTLAAELRLKPKRGVLLAGPPGTGKTTIGRALAHRLKSKFFLIDGTVVAGSGDFYEKVDEIFEAAKRNAPSVVFIDDTDVIFEGGEERGFCRYLLTMLDGLESASAERVCVMMTAMCVSNLPAAMLRSGRIELWLETKLPDHAARGVIIAERLAGIPAPLCEVEIPVLAAASHGLTGADLKAMVEDAKLLYAHDLAAGTEVRAMERYFLEAIGTIRANKKSYGRSKPPKFGEPVHFGFFDEDDDELGAG